MTTETKKQKPAAFIFGARPESIPGTVEFTSVTGQDVKLECQFIYRTRKEFGEFWDKILGANASSANSGELFSHAKFADQTIETNADRISQVLKSWPLDLPLNRETLLQMFDEEPEAAGAFWDKYTQLCFAGIQRQGNSKPQ